MNEKNTNFEDVINFHEKFGLYNTSDGKPALLDLNMMGFRLAFLQEELNETCKAYEENNLYEIADGLVDLVYVALGTAYLMGLPWQELWDEVHRANMSKKRVKRAGESKRDSVYDVVKPNDWVAPDIEGVILKCTSTD